MNRRNFLASVGGFIAYETMRRNSLEAQTVPAFKFDPFTVGVASGDPAPDGVVLWTRLTSDTPVGVNEIPQVAIPVSWEVATDESMRHIVQHGSAVATPELGHSVHVEVAGLKPSSDYFYRFHCGGSTSRVGKTRTAPAFDAHPDHVRFGFASCQHYEDGYYTVHREMANADLDAVIFLGDYIYEHHVTYPPTRKHDVDLVVTLAQYRHHYAQYKRDPDLQACHAAHPWIVTLDDHEVTNNWAGMSTSPAHPEENFLQRRASALQAYYENMPLRRSTYLGPKGLRLYRKVQYGQMAQFTVLDTRQFRTPQPCGDRVKPTCEERERPEGTMMGFEQEKWFNETLSASPTTWNIIANQVMVAQLDIPQNGVETHAMDMWDGYPAARKRMLDFLATRKPNNPVYITGDAHQTWVSDLKRNFDDPKSPIVASEILGTSISSGRNGVDHRPVSDMLMKANPHILYSHSRRGFFLCELT
ncbi:MAG TPA: alkaline phosphatase D family protein, partial [Edaphobacter sp.]